MVHLQFMSLALALIDKSSDGDLTVNEVIECLGDFSPDYFEDLKQAVIAAQADGKITVMEVINIVSSIVT